MGRPSFFNSASWWANSRAGNFEDYLMQDVWNFVMDELLHPSRSRRPCPARRLHGGSAAFAHAMKYKDRIKICAGFMPALNLRWVDCHGNYERKFDPNCWGWREKCSPLEVIGRPGWGLVKIRYCTLFGPACGRWGQESIAELSRINPIEIMERVNLQDKELDLYVAYGGKDEFQHGRPGGKFSVPGQATRRQRGGRLRSAWPARRGHRRASTSPRPFAGSLRWWAVIALSDAACGVASSLASRKQHP